MLVGILMCQCYICMQSDLSFFACIVSAFGDKLRKSIGNVFIFMWGGIPTWGIHKLLKQFFCRFSKTGSPQTSRHLTQCLAHSRHTTYICLIVMRFWSCCRGSKCSQSLLLSCGVRALHLLDLTSLTFCPVFLFTSWSIYAVVDLKML